MVTDQFKRTIRQSIASLPQIGMLLSYRWFGIEIAAACFLVLNTFIFCIEFFVYLHYGIFNFILLLILLCFSFLAFLTGEYSYFKIFFTIYYLLQSALMFGGMKLKKNFLDLVVGDVADEAVVEKVSSELSKILFCLFAVIAIVNEIVRRCFGDGVWLFIVTICYSLIGCVVLAIKLIIINREAK